MNFRTTLLFAPLFLAAIGCHGRLQHARPHGPDGAHGQPVANPLPVAVRDHELVWTQVSDAVARHFRLQREERVRVVGDVILEGRLETFPTVGSTVLEPWQGDSTHGFERWHATLQSVRRRAVARVIPAQNGFLVDLAVFKELEDLNQPEHATVARADVRAQGPLLRTDEETVDPGGVTIGWIPLGRDAQLEQRILRDVQARLAL